MIIKKKNMFGLDQVMKKKFEFMDFVCFSWSFLMFSYYLKLSYAVARSLKKKLQIIPSKGKIYKSVLRFYLKGEDTKT